MSATASKYVLILDGDTTHPLTGTFGPALSYLDRHDPIELLYCGAFKRPGQCPSGVKSTRSGRGQVESALLPKAASTVAAQQFMMGWTPRPTASMCQSGGAEHH
jgi:hypothetical protein